jgi:sugar phosphate isomerase/epimerase
MTLTRKSFLTTSVLATAGAALQSTGFGQPSIRDTNKLKICAFSKHLQWLDYNGMASAAAEMGFDGVDLAVRKNGHVRPEKVEEDLPKAVNAVRKAGIEVYMISTDILDTNDPLTERVLKTAAGLKIKNYRTGWFTYRKDLDIPANIEIFKKQFANLHRKYGLHADYQNHSGEGFGSSIWDLWLSIKDLDPRYIGSQYDIYHATVAGAYSWPVGLELLHKYVHTTDIKDFKWELNEGKWKLTPVPLGEGMVDLAKYLKLVKSYNIPGPITLHCDYRSGGSENGATTLTIPGSQVITAIRKDLAVLKKLMGEAGL